MMKPLLTLGSIALLTIPSVEGLLQGDSLTNSRISQLTTTLSVSSTSPNAQRKDASSSNGESEAERLLWLARKLRQQAEEEEQHVHEHLYEKKRKEDEQLDQWIKNLGLSEVSAKHDKKHTHIVNQLKDRKPCMDTLERIVDRLHEHHLIASGHECVQAPSSSHHGSSVQRVHHQKDDAQVQKVELQAEALFGALDIIDDELFRQHHSSSQPLEKSLLAAESRHWGGDQRAKQLRTHWQALLREHAEQFVKRQASFIEAQTIKKDLPPPPKVKDDHGLLP